MKIGQYVLENEEKVKRAIEGTEVENNKVVGGVGQQASDEAILAEYDKLGGLITKNGLKVRTGSFYDVKKRTPRAKPEVLFEVSLEGNLLSVAEEEAKAIGVATEKLASLKKKRKPSDEVPAGKKRIKIKDVRDEE